MNNEITTACPGIVTVAVGNVLLLIMTDNLFNADGSDELATRHQRAQSASDLPAEPPRGRQLYSVLSTKRARSRSPSPTPSQSVSQVWPAPLLQNEEQALPQPGLHGQGLDKASSMVTVSTSSANDQT